MTEDEDRFVGVRGGPLTARPYEATCRHGGTRRYVGAFATAEEAALCRARMLAQPAPPTPPPQLPPQPARPPSKRVLAALPPLSALEQWRKEMSARQLMDQEVSSQFARQILVASHPVLSRGVVSYEDVRGVLRAELDGVADAIESIGTVAEAYVGFTCDIGRRRSEHGAGLPGWDVYFTLHQFVGGLEADATIPLFKRCEQAAIDIFKAHWRLTNTLRSGWSTRTTTAGLYLLVQWKRPS